MVIAARLNPGEALGDRILKVDHAGEHGAVCIYKAQRWISRWRAPQLLPELDEFIAHETRHRLNFKAELDRRGRKRCRSYMLCGIGGLALGGLTGLAGPQAIAATTVAIERVVLRHMHEQALELGGIDAAASAALADVMQDEQEHHDRSLAQLAGGSVWPKLIDPVVSVSTEVVIWLGMRL